MQRSNPFFRKSLPYCFTKLKSDAHRHVWLPLNRDYKPLGFLGRSWANYQDHIANAVVFSRDPSTFKNVWDGGISSTDCFLYNDGSDLAEYFNRLEKLLSHQHSLYGLTTAGRSSWLNIQLDKRYQDGAADRPIRDGS